MSNIHEKLAAIQQELVAPKNQWNKFGGYSYRSCEDILEGLKEPLKKNKCSLRIKDNIEAIGERYYVKAIATFIDNETGEIIENHAFAREEENKKGMDGSQITGAASSYARKYCLNGLFLIDDQKDADTDEFAVQNKKQEKRVQAKPKDDFSSEKESLKQLVTENARSGKMSKKDALSIMKKHGIDSFELISSKEQYEAIVKDIGDACK